MKLKPGVKLAGLQPQIAVALTIARDAYNDIGVELIVTSCNDSKHSDTSLHYKGRAADCRTHTVPRPLLNALVTRLKENLGFEFDVVLEGEKTANEHIHIEYDPQEVT